MNSSLWKKILLLLIFLITPTTVSANGNGIAWLALFGFMGFVIFAALLIPIFLLYPLRHKSHVLLLLVDVVFAAIYALIINFGLPTYDVAEMLGFTISTFVIFAVILGTILLVKKIRGSDISSLSKVFLHGIIVGIITILFAVSFTYGAGWMLYSTNCDINIILNSEFKRSEGYQCVVKKAIKQGSPTFCNKLTNSWEIKEVDFCKLRVNIEMVQSGDLSACSYLKSKESEVLYNEGTIRGQEILERCTER